MNTDKTALTAVKDFLKGKTMRVSNANLNEPPGGTYRAVHENEVADLLNEFSSQQNKELIEENERLLNEKEALGNALQFDINSYKEQIENMNTKLQESQQLNERLVRCMKDVQSAVNHAPQEWLMTRDLGVAMLAVDELLSSTKEKIDNVDKTAYTDESFNDWVTKKWHDKELKLGGLSLNSESMYWYKKKYLTHTQLYPIYLQEKGGEE